MKRVPLTKGQHALVDDEDFERVSTLKWYARAEVNTYYAKRSIYPGGKLKTLPMTNFILGSPIGQIIDHIDLNGLNNMRANLRAATRRQNARNCRKQVQRSSRFKGVHWSPAAKKWQVQIRVDGKQLYLGIFDSEIEAARAYDAAALARDPEFKNLNKV